MGAPRAPHAFVRYSARERREERRLADAVAPNERDVLARQGEREAFEENAAAGKCERRAPHVKQGRLGSRGALGS